MKSYCGTTIFCLIAGDCIVIGADSMAGSKNCPIDSMTKLRPIHNCIIACEGLGALYKMETGVIYYRADEWMAKVEQNFQFATDARTIASLIEATHPFVDIFKVERQAYSLYEYQKGKGYLAEFLVVSIVAERFSVVTVRASVDGMNWKIVFKTTVHLDRPSPINSFLHHEVGRIGEIKKAFSGNGDTYEDMLVRTDGSFGRLLGGEKVGLDELRNIARSVIALEAKANPETVGPPFSIATLQHGKPVVVMSYSK